MNIQVLRSRLEDDNSKTGVGNYADLIESMLDDTGTETEIIPFQLSVDKGIKNMIREGFIDPLSRILAGRKRTDVIHVTLEYCSLLIPFARAKKVVTFHHIAKNGEGNTRKGFVMWRFSAWVAVVFADKIITISPQTKEEILQRYNVRPSKIEAVLYAPEGFSVLKDVEKEHIIGCMGTLNARKNFASAINVFGSIVKDDKFGDYKMMICGKGPLKNELLEQARSMGIGEKVAFVENLSKEEMVRFYNKCSLFLNTASHEGLGMATVEAQMCGTPVLYYEDAEIPKEVTAAAVACRCEEDMAEKAKEILGDECRMKELTENGLEHSKELGRDFKEKTLDVYYSLL